MPTSSKLSVAVALIVASSTAFAQSTETFSDSHAQQLWDKYPSTYVSERDYQSQWTSVADTNILWAKRLWRTVDKSAKGNELLAKASAVSNDPVVEGVRQGKYKTYLDDRFTTKRGTEAISDYDAAHITKYKIKEEWLYIETEHKLEVRIIAIAPVKQVVQPDGTTTEETLFWVYFPEARKYLAEQKIPGSTDPALQNIDQLLDTHHFVAGIDKISMRVKTGVDTVAGNEKTLRWARWKYIDGKL